MSQKFFMYKGYPLVRNKNELYYGFMRDPFVINLKILTAKKTGDIEMEETALIDKLMLFGLTRQEACIYICLASNHELSGYEVAKITGISRSNVYNALASLVEEGAAYLLEGSTNKYTPVEIGEFCENKIRGLQKAKEELNIESREFMEAAERAAEDEDKKTEKE